MKPFPTSGTNPLRLRGAAGEEGTEPGIHLRSLEFAEREVLYARHRAHRAMQHLDIVGDLPIPELRKFAHVSACEAVAHFRSALGKRAFEIRELTSDR